jgi:hypothetical protein
MRLDTVSKVIDIEIPLFYPDLDTDRAKPRRRGCERPKTARLAVSGCSFGRHARGRWKKVSSGPGRCRAQAGSRGGEQL